MLYGSLISSIDPVATLSILGSMGIRKDHVLYVVVFGESILNDGVAIALFDSLKLHLERHGSHGDDNSDSGSNDHSTLIKESIQYFIKICIGSISIGIVIGIVCTIYFWLLRGKQSPVMEVGTFFCFAFLAYYSSDGLLGCSGIVSIMTAGFIMDIYVRGSSSESALSELESGLESSASSPGVTSSSMSERDEAYELGLRTEGQDDSDGMNDESSNINTGAATTSTGDLYASISSSAMTMTTRPRCFTQCTPQSFYTDLRIMFSGVGHMSPRAKIHVGFVADVLANLMETSIFAYLGLFLFSNKKWDDLPLIIVGVLSCVLSRVVMISVTSFFVNGGIMVKNHTFYWWRRICWYIGHRFMNGSSGDDQPIPIQQYDSGLNNNSNNGNNDNDSYYIDRNMQLVLLYSGVRGAVSLALAENIPLYNAVTKSGSEFKPALKAMTSSSIIFTVFFFGASTYFTLKRQRERINNQSSTDDTAINNVIGGNGGGRNGNGVGGFMRGILNREIFDEDDRALYDLSLQDNTRTSLTTSLLQDDSTENNEGRHLPPWMRPSDGAGVE